ncbi:hypothetical protein FPQ18DRAFT_302780 [Pyronema domesticum]|nr:hypothetical protein FPQ18DRAFT_302780 [Pyronema domesticum]
MAAEYKNSSITLGTSGEVSKKGHRQSHLLRPIVTEIHGCQDMGNGNNRQSNATLRKVRKKHFPEALDKEVYQVLGNFFNLMKEYHGCRKLAQRLWKGLSKKNGYYKSDGDLLVKRKLSGNQWILAHILLGFFLDLIRELDAHTSALTLKDNKHNDLLQTPPSIKVEVTGPSYVQSLKIGNMVELAVLDSVNIATKSMVSAAYRGLTAAQYPAQTVQILFYEENVEEMWSVCIRPYNVKFDDLRYEIPPQVLKALKRQVQQLQRGC